MKLSKLYIFSIVFIIISGCANGVMDTLQFHYSESIYAEFKNQQYWNPKISWKNKYKSDVEGNLLRPLKPKFIGSVTFFVWTTDAWHFFKMIYHSFWKILIAILLTEILIFKRSMKLKKRGYVAIYSAIFFSLYTIQAIGFHFIYTIIK